MAVLVVDARNAGRRMKETLSSLFDSYQSAAYIDDQIIEVVLPVIPKRVGSIISLTKIYCANVNLYDWTMHLYATRKDYFEGKTTEHIKIGLCYGRTQEQTGSSPSETTEGSY